MATSTGTSSISLAANTKYSLTAGGKSYIFTTPPDNNTTYDLSAYVNNITTSGSGNAITSVTKTGNGATFTLGKTFSESTHTHTLNMATSSGTSAISLKANTKYTITAGGNSYIFTTPTDNNTTYAAGTGLTGTTTFSLATTGTAGTYGPSANVTGSNGATIAVPQITTDAYGRVTSVTNRTYTSVNTDNDTKNTAGSTDTSSKIFLIGATSQAANPQTYSDNEVYATNGVLTTKGVQIGGGAATLQYNANTQSIDFVQKY